MALASEKWHAWRGRRMIDQEGQNDMIGQVSRWCWECFWPRQHSEHLVSTSRERIESLYVCMNCAKQTLSTLVWCEYHQGWSPANLANVYQTLKDGRSLYMCCACDDFYNGPDPDDDRDGSYW